MLTQEIEYKDGNTNLKGFLAEDDKHAGKRPAVLVCHDWSGRNEFACQKAQQLAELGYVGFALDMYGDAKVFKTKEEKSAQIQPFIQDRTKLLKRILAAFNTVKMLKNVDADKIAAIGFCFGGLCVLDLARSGANLKGVVSFHGLLNPPQPAFNQPIKAKVLALHGYDDPMVTPDQIINFGHEMTHAKVDWQFHIYGNTMHAFTNPEANDPSFGTVYNKDADSRSWIEMKNFLNEIFR